MILRHPILVAIAGVLALTASSLKAADRNHLEQAEEHLRLPDKHWITLPGVVSSITGDSFTMAHGGDSIKVELDDWDWRPETAKLQLGDEVTVSGVIDDDFFERRSIEARTVYVERLEVHLLGNTADEEGYSDVGDPLLAREGDWVSISGVVDDLNGDEFILSSGRQRLTVDVDKLSDNPFDKWGRPQIFPGQRVIVFGRMDDADLLDGREIEAHSVVRVM